MINCLTTNDRCSISKSFQEKVKSRLSFLVLDQVGSEGQKVIGTELDAIQLSIFSHRFMSTAEQMGRVLQRTSISTNIKVSL